MAAASDVLATADLADISKILTRRAERRTLVVLDIDDTLLTSAGFFGSDRWYEWQRALAPEAPGYVPCRFDIMAMSYESGTQVLTQPDAVAVVNSIRNDSIILTARSERSRAATVRELKHAGYEVPRMLGGADGGLNYEWHPANSSRGPVLVGYHEGVFMIAGQNKGVLLLDLLHRLHLSYRQIVLVDDSEKNIEEMRDALASAGIAYVGLHYTRVPKIISDEDVQTGIAAWQAWQRLLSSTYPQRLQRLVQNDCYY